MKRIGEIALVTIIGAAAFVACDPLGGTQTATVASISDLQVPYPTVVVGDVMRDSLGVATALKLDAFDPQGRLILTQPISINILDGTNNTPDSTIHIDQAGFLRGIYRDTVGARVFASAGSLEAPVVRIFVSVAPQTATQSSAPTPIVFDVTTPDTSAQSNWSPPLAVTLANNQGIPAQGFVITWAITKMPTPASAGGITAYLADDAAKPSNRDTTDVKGIAGRRVVLRQSAIEAALKAGTKTDTVIVVATVKYNGDPVSGTPFTYIIPVSKKP